MPINKVVYGNTTLIDISNTTATPSDILSSAGAYGADGTWIDGTLTQVYPSDDTPQMDGTASAGVSINYSRADHVHPHDSTIPSNLSDLINDTNFITGMVILSYGSSTWDDFIAAYNAKKVVYCRASSNNNPGSGSQTRLAFMAYVNNAETPTSVEFQYYRSVSSHTAAQQGDQVYVYKLDKTNGWTVTVREAYTKIVAGTGLSSSYDNGALTLNATASGGDSTLGITGASVGNVVSIGAVDSAGAPTAFTYDVIPSVPSAYDTVPEMNGVAAAGSADTWARGDHVHPRDSAIVHENLLDNWYFGGGNTGNIYGKFPINRRNGQPYSGVQYTIDRWKNSSSVVTTSLSSDCITTSHNGDSAKLVLYQPLDIIEKGTYTISALVKSTSGNFALGVGISNDDTKRILCDSFNGYGLFSATGTFSENITDGKAYIASRTQGESSIELIAFKFERGDTQTLAHQEGNTWVLNELPNYEEQLIRCKISKVDSTDTYANNTIGMSDDCVAKAGDTMTGTLYHKFSQIVIGTPSTADKWYTAHQILSSNNAIIGGFYGTYYSSDRLGITIGGQRIVAGTPKYNWLGLTLDSSGNQIVSVTNATAWRTTLSVPSTSEVLLKTGGTVTGQIKSTALNSAFYVAHASANNAAYYVAHRTDTDVRTSFGVGTGGVNHGIYSYKLGKWIVYADDSQIYLNGNASTATTAGNVTGIVAIANGGTGASSSASARANLGVVANTGDTMTGALTVSRSAGAGIAGLLLKTADFTSNTAVQSASWATGVRFCDSSDTVVGYLSPALSTSGLEGLQMRYRRKVNTTNVDNYLVLYVNSSGSRSVAVSEAAPWREALGLGNAAVDDIVTIAHGGTGASTSASARANLGLPILFEAKSVSTTTGAKGTFNLVNAEKGFIVQVSNEPMYNGMIYYYTTNAGVVNYSETLQNPNLLIATSSNKLTVTNNTGKYIVLMKYGWIP